MSHPFAREGMLCLVLVNDEGQHTLWPEPIEVPNGWERTFRGSYEEAVEYVDENWSDMRPKSLANAMGTPAEPLGDMGSGH